MIYKIVFVYFKSKESTAVFIMTRTLASYEYIQDQNRYLKILEYGNGDKVQYTYDDYGRLILETFEDGDTVSYAYDNTGALATVTDSATGRKTTYYYDFTDRLMKYTESGTNFYHSVGYEYDSLNNLTALVELINGVARSTTYTYDEDNRVSEIDNDATTIKYTYDEYGRVVKKEQGIFSYVYTYATNANGAPTGQIKRHYFYTNNALGTWSYSYTYDANGNILTASDMPHQISYEYDSANQLICERNPWASRIWEWTYDDAGNITSRTEYAYTTGALGDPIDTVEYTYGDSTWGDLLTAYDGVTITYDGIGNPLTDGTWTYTWEHGRELATMSSGSTTWTYTYDANGMRTSRTNGTTTYNYIYNGSQLVQMTVGNDTLYFTYDASGVPTTVTLNGVVYYYVVNMQGDVVAIYTADGTSVCYYNYNAWGKTVTATTNNNYTIDELNPLRYRGYVYDSDTGLYYLQSRYYNPEWGRFINADGYTSTGQGTLGNNMFAYCGNNPVIREDEGGKFWNVVIGAVVGAVVNATTTAIDSYITTGSVDWGKVGISAAVGAVSGGIAATGLGVIAQAAISAGAAAIGSVATDLYERDKNPNAGDITWGEVGDIAVRAVGSAAISFGASVFGTAAGKMVSDGLTDAGASMVFRGKIGAGCWTKAQARNMVKQGTAMINTARGISSVVGTVFTWPTSTALSMAISSGGSQ